MKNAPKFRTNHKMKVKEPFTALLLTSRHLNIDINYIHSEKWCRLCPGIFSLVPKLNELIALYSGHWDAFLSHNLPILNADFKMLLYI
jgi:hypothetical protein